MLNFSLQIYFVSDYGNSRSICMLHQWRVLSKYLGSIFELISDPNIDTANTANYLIEIPWSFLTYTFGVCVRSYAHILFSYCRKQAENLWCSGHPRSQVYAVKGRSQWPSTLFLQGVLWRDTFPSFLRYMNTHDIRSWLTFLVDLH